MNPSLRARLRVGFGLLAAVILAVAVLGVGALFQVRTDYEDRISASFERELAAEQLRSAFVIEQTALRSGPSRRARRRAFATAAAGADRVSAEASRRAAGDPELALLLEERLATERRWRTDVAQPLLAGRAVPAGRESRLANAVVDAAEELVARERAERDRARDDAAADTRTALAATIVGLGLAAALAVLVFAQSIRSMRDPLAGLVLAARRLADGDLGARVAPAGPIETATLGRAFNEMAGEIESAYERIGEGRRRLAVIIESLADGLITVDATGRVTELNETARRMFPAARTGTHLALALGELAPPDPDVVGLIRGEGGELVIHDSARTLALASSPLGEAGRAGGAVISVRDATERVRTERMKDEFLLTASHELRSPVTSVQGFAELLMLERERLSDSQAEKVEVILESAKQLVAVFNDLLDLARSDAGRLRIDARVTEVGPMVETAARMAQPSIERRGQTLDVDVEEGLPPVMADPARIQQVLSNLIDNAHKYTPQGGSLGIAARRAGDRVEIAVTDQGPGISAGELEHVFDRFWRADASETQSVGGTGLGLAIAKSLVTLHGGAVAVDSEPERGSTFRVLLPAATTGPAEGAARTVEAE